MSDPLGTTIRTMWGSAGGSDLDPYFRRVSGAEAVAHTVMRRLVTRRGSLKWAPNVGYDVRDLLNSAINTASSGPLRAIESYIRAECVADDRVTDAKVTVTLGQSRKHLTIDVTLILSTKQTFRFVLKASALTLELLAE